MYENEKTKILYYIIYILVLYKKKVYKICVMLLIYKYRVLCIYDNNSDKAQCMPNKLLLLYKHTYIRVHLVMNFSVNSFFNNCCRKLEISFIFITVIIFFLFNILYF